MCAPSSVMTSSTPSSVIARSLWALLCLTVSVYLSDTTGLRVDYQVQRQTEANEKYDGPRNPLGLLLGKHEPAREFAGLGDATGFKDA